MPQDTAPEDLGGDVVPIEDYGKVLGEVRAVVRSTHNRQAEALVRMSALEERMASFVDPVTRRARMALIFSGAALGGLIAGFLVELAVRALGHEVGVVVALAMGG